MVQTAPFAPPSPPRGRWTRRRLARLAQSGLLISVLAAVIVAGVPWGSSTAALSTAIIAQIRKITGLVALSQGRAVFVVLPQPHVNIDDVELTNPAGTLRIGARVLKGYLRISSLLRGRLEIGSVILHQPDLSVDLDRWPISADSAIGLAANARPASPQASAADEEGLGAVSIVDGTARLRSKASALDVGLEAINVKMDWRRLGAAATVNGQARLYNEPLSFALRIDRPSDLMRGQQSAIALSLESAPLTLMAEGLSARTPAPRFTGRAITSAPSLRRLVEAAGFAVPLPAPFANFSMRSELDLSASSLTFSNLRLALDGNDFEGALAVDATANPPIIAGTLAANQLSLRPFVSGLPQFMGRDRQWSRDPFDLHSETATDLDLRVSAGRATLSAFEIEDAALSVLRRGARLEVILTEAKAYRGLVNGRASVAFSDGVAAIRASGAMKGVDVAALTAGSGSPWRFSGAMTASAQFESSGASPSEVMHGLAGTAKIALAQGVVGGLDLVEALRGIEAKPLSLTTNIQQGGTAFDEASFGLAVADGAASIEHGLLISPRVNLNFGGDADIGERSLMLHGAAEASARTDHSDKPAPEAPLFRFDIAGSWDDLAFIPDARSLIRRSGAAAPLLTPRPPLKPAGKAE